MHWVKTVHLFFWKFVNVYLVGSICSSFFFKRIFNLCLTDHASNLPDFIHFKGSKEIYWINLILYFIKEIVSLFFFFLTNMKAWFWFIQNVYFFLISSFELFIPLSLPFITLNFNNRHMVMHWHITNLACQSVVMAIVN